MSTRALAIRPASAAVTLGALAATLAVCLAMVLDVRFGIVLLAVICFTAVALVDLSWGVAMWVPLGFTAASIPALFPALTAGAIVLLISCLGERRRLRHAGAPRTVRRPVVAAAALGVWLLLSLGWAEKPAEGRPIMISWACALVVFVIIVSTLTSGRQLRVLAAAFVVGAVLSVIAGIATEGLASTAGGSLAPDTGLRTPGGADANLLAAALIPGLVLAAALFTTTRSLVARGLLLAAVAVMVFGIVQTQSRGAAVGFGVALAAALVVARRQRGQIIVGTVAVATLAAAVFAVFPGTFERMTTIDSTGTGRTELWGVAWEMWRDHPIVGVGLANFPEESERYVRRPGSLQYVEDIVYRPHVVHNTYLGTLVETGVIGLALLLAALLACVEAARRAARRFDRAGRAREAALARAVLLGALGMLAADFFLSGGHDTRLWTLLALGPALLAASTAPSR